MGDGISLALAPLVASAGVTVPMMSGRGLGHTGGTLDKLESIPGFKVQLPVPKILDQLRNLRVCMFGQSEHLCPADRKLYSLRDASGTVGSVPLIVASILSKKMAEDLRGLVLDVKAGSGALTLGVPSSPGVPAGVVEHTITLPYNDATAVQEIFAELGEQVAGVIVEPIAGNMNMVPPETGFHETLRDECTKAGAILIFDEVMTGFRVAKGGAQALFSIEPDLTTLGKVIGGGMPAAAFGGRADIMSSITPDGPVYQAGTLSGNPVAMAAGLATLEIIDQPGFYDALGERTRQLSDGLAAAGAAAGIPIATEFEGGMFGFVFSDDGPIRRFEQVAAADIERFRAFFHGMLEEGVYLAPSAFEAGFVSAAHGDEEISATLAAAKKVLASM